MAFVRRTSRSRLVAWLAMAAVWLTVVMPVISRSLPMSGMDGMDAGAWCTSHGLSTQHPPASPNPSSSLDKCGYCSLFCHSPMVAGGAVLLPPPQRFPAQDLLAPVVPAGPAPRLISASPRGPPPQV
jgi:Protein of unknown function (DUF2946).